MIVCPYFVYIVDMKNYDTLCRKILFSIHKMEIVHSSSGHVGKLFRSKKFSPCEDIQLCRSHLHILQNPIQGINQTSATILQRVADHYNPLDVNNCMKTPKSLESKWRLIQRECNIYNIYYMNVKTLNKSSITKEDIQQKGDK